MSKIIKLINQLDITKIQCINCKKWKNKEKIWHDTNFNINVCNKCHSKGKF
jgi:NAD-dependent SIR2 family protein deacetylase